ncbi:MAG: hypothetical protein D6711_12120, partial [Chloroflexi bacterium]
TATPTLSEFAIRATSAALTREAVTEVPTLSNFAIQATNAALTREAQPTATAIPEVEPSLTPIGELAEVEISGAPEEPNNLIPIIAICGGALLLLIVVLIIRRRK